MRIRSILRYFQARSGFTLIELLTVMAIIAVIAGLILSIAGYAQKQGASSRAKAEMKAIEAACEAYKADFGTYPKQSAVTQPSKFPSDTLCPTGPSADYNSTDQTYKDSSLMLYQALTGDTNNVGMAVNSSQKNYLQDIRPDMLGRANPTQPVGTGNAVTFLSDPFGNSYGYSTAYATAVASGSTPTPPNGYNPTFDLWCTDGQTTSGGTSAWIKNW